MLSKRPTSHHAANQTLAAVAGIDIGTSSLKGVVVAEDGRVAAKAHLPITVTHPSPDRAELAPSEYIETVLRLLGMLVSKADGFSINAVSIASASGSGLLVDGAGTPLSNIISWMDRRAVSETQTTLPHLNIEEVHSVVGWPWRARFAFAQFAWIRHYEPELFRKANLLCTSVDFVHHRLTGKRCIDTSSATPSFMQNQLTGAWHAPYLAMLDRNESAMPTIVDTGEPVAKISADAGAYCGLNARTTLVAGSFDHPAAARSLDVLNPGQLLLSCGTSWVLFAPTTDRASAIGEGLLVDPFRFRQGVWGAMASLSRVGAAIDYFVDNLVAPEYTSKEERLSRFDALAAQAATESREVFVDLGRWVLDRSVKFNEPIERTAPASLARGLMECVVFDVRRRLESLSAAGFRFDEIKMVGGPSESAVWCGIVANVLGKEIGLGNGRNSGARGAAQIAGAALGYFDTGYAGCSARSVFPDQHEARRADERYRNYLEWKATLLDER